jgi:hypothetical protein
MKPYRDAIKSADSNALVAVFFSDPARPGVSWDNDLGNYTNRYWDAVIYHHYPELPASYSFADLMALDNAVLYRACPKRAVFGNGIIITKDFITQHQFSWVLSVAALPFGPK